MENHEAMLDEAYPLQDHLVELRRRLIWVALTFFAVLIVSFLYSLDIFYWIREHAYLDKAIYTRNPADPLKVYMQISFIFAFFFTSPVAMYHLWQFVRPGLHPREQRAALFYIPFALILFGIGVLFAFCWVFPAIMHFLVSLNQQMGLQQLYGVYDAFSFLLNIVFPIALFFELPVVVLFLTRIGMVTPALLRKVRRYAYLVLVVFSAMIAPPDLISNLLVLFPLLVLYELSILLSNWSVRRMDR